MSSISSADKGSASSAQQDTKDTYKWIQEESAKFRNLVTIEGFIYNCTKHIPQQK